MSANEMAGLDLPRLFTPAQAAEILRGLGMSEMTECALRTRAYRRQVPYHLNGRRIQFTGSDLREIVEAQPRRPEENSTTGDMPQRASAARHGSRARTSTFANETWRARPPRTATAAGEAR